MSVSPNKAQLLQIIDVLMNPKGYPEKYIDRQLLNFCAACPDPVGAMRLIVECLDPMTDEELVDRALAMPMRPMAFVPPTELPADHPLRAMVR